MWKLQPDPLHFVEELWASLDDALDVEIILTRGDRLASPVDIFSDSWVLDCDVLMFGLAFPLDESPLPLNEEFSEGLFWMGAAELLLLIAAPFALLLIWDRFDRSALNIFLSRLLFNKTKKILQKIVSLWRD